MTRLRQIGAAALVSLATLGLAACGDEIEQTATTPEVSEERDDDDGAVERQRAIQGTEREGEGIVGEREGQLNIERDNGGERDTE